MVLRVVPKYTQLPRPAIAVKSPKCASLAGGGLVKESTVPLRPRVPADKGRGQEIYHIFRTELAFNNKQSIFQKLKSIGGQLTLDFNNI